MRTRTKIWVLAAVLLTAPACGGSLRAANDVPVEHEAESPVELESEQEQRLEQLETALARPESDCEDTCALSEVICDLRDRICGIADRNPLAAETQARCRDAAERCDRGRERVQAVCTCPL